MKCLKCGTETQGKDVFCSGCQSVMKRYPVRPGTMVQLPQRQNSVRKIPVKRAPKPEELLPQMRKTIKRLTIAVVALAVALAVAVATMVYLGTRGEPQEPTGRNYYTVST